MREKRTQAILRPAADTLEKDTSTEMKHSRCSLREPLTIAEKRPASKALF